MSNTLHPSAYDYLIPTELQMNQMNEVRERFRQLSDYLDAALSSGPDKTYVLRKLRECAMCAMWTNISPAMPTALFARERKDA
jgi:hypothetical protein